MKILVLGSDGMAGYGIFNTLKKYEEYIVYGTTRNISCYDSNIITGIDAKEISQIEKIIDDNEIDYVINCIGIIKQKQYANIDFITINSVFPHKLASICIKYHTKLIHLSTDCVFDGSKGDYKEHDSASPTDIYSESKYCGEIFEQNSICIRTSIIGQEPRKNKYGLVEWFLSHDKNSHVFGYKNAIFSGLPTVVLADIIHRYVLKNNKLSGLYHIASEPISKYDLLILIAKYFHKQTSIIPNEIIRCNRSLSYSKFQNITGYVSDPWEKMIKTMYNNWINHDS